MRSHQKQHTRPAHPPISTTTPIAASPLNQKLPFKDRYGLRRDAPATRRFFRNTTPILFSTSSFQVIAPDQNKEKTRTPRKTNRADVSNYASRR